MKPFVNDKVHGCYWENYYHEAHENIIKRSAHQFDTLVADKVRPLPVSNNLSQIVGFDSGCVRYCSL